MTSTLAPTTIIRLLAGASLFALAACGGGDTAESPTATPYPIEQTAPAEGQNADEVSESQRLATFFEELFQRDVDNSPMFQAQLGIKTEDYGKWDDFSAAEAERQIEQVRQDLDTLRSDFDFEKLDPDAQISYRIFEYDQENTLKNWDWRFNEYPVTQMNSIATHLPTFLQNVHQVASVGDAEAYISRIEGIEGVGSVRVGIAVSIGVGCTIAIGVGCSVAIGVGCSVTIGVG